MRNSDRFLRLGLFLLAAGSARNGLAMRQCLPVMATVAPLHSLQLYVPRETSPKANAREREASLVEHLAGHGVPEYTVSRLIQVSQRHRVSAFLLARAYLAIQSKSLTQGDRVTLLELGLSKNRVSKIVSLIKGIEESLSGWDLQSEDTKRLVTLALESNLSDQETARLFLKLRPNYRYNESAVKAVQTASEQNPRSLLDQHYSVRGNRSETHTDAFGNVHTYYFRKDGTVAHYLGQT